MRKLFGVCVGALFMVGYVVPVAHAGYEGGRITCTSGATCAVRGEQTNKSDYMTLTVGTKTLKLSGKVQVLDAGVGGTRTWRAESPSLVDSGTYGFCKAL